MAYIHHFVNVYCFNIIQNILACISSNVLDIRRSSPPYKAIRSIAVGWNVGERKPHKGEADWCFSNPEPPNRRRSVYRLLDDVRFCFILRKNNIHNTIYAHMVIPCPWKYIKYLYFKRSVVTPPPRIIFR